MSQYYELLSEGPPPVSLEEMKAALGRPAKQHPDDDYLNLLILGTTQIVEKYLGRDVRANQRRLYLDEFEDRICLRKDPVDAIDDVERLVSGTWTSVSNPSTTYYLKPSTQFSEVLLFEDQSWPVDEDDVEHAVRVTFTTKAHDCADAAEAAIIRAVTYQYENRGDCDAAGAKAALEQSGAAGLLQYARIQRC